MRRAGGFGVVEGVSKRGPREGTKALARGLSVRQGKLRQVRNIYIVPVFAINGGRTRTSIQVLRT